MDFVRGACLDWSDQRFINRLRLTSHGQTKFQINVMKRQPPEQEEPSHEQEVGAEQLSCLLVEQQVLEQQEPGAGIQSKTLDKYK